MSYRILIILSYLVSVLALESCSSTPKKSSFSPKDYDLSSPSILYLNDALSEISGIYFYPKDSGVFAISDNYGYLFKINLDKDFIIQKWKFDKNQDFEDISFKDSSFYILQSNGNIHTIQFSEQGDTVKTQTSLFPDDEKGKNEFEAFYYDSILKSFVLICKNCKSDKKNTVSAWAYHPESNSYTPSVFTIDVSLITKKAGLKKLKFEPSAATINPLTGDLWILSSVNLLLVIADRSGNCKEVFKLNEATFTQPEGMTFTPSGDLIISNEAGNKYSSPSLLIFKRKTP
ncbi:MAG: SdiA-regulated domain-containing protein [Ginsengibacter sp.]